MTLAFRNYEIFGLDERGFFVDESFLPGITKGAMTITTFCISVFTGSFGMAKFLKLGPCQIVPSQDMHCGFFFVFMSMATALVSKGCVLAFSLVNRPGKYETFTYTITCLIWISSCILPQFILVSIKTNPYSQTLIIFLFDK